MTIIKTESFRRCPDILPIRDSDGSLIVIEKRCILPLDHPGLHRDLSGACWVNQWWLLRQRGIHPSDT